MFVVIFEVQPHPEQFGQYLEYGKLLRPELEQIDGFIDNERFTSAEHAGRILSLSSWRDEKALIRWRTHARHHDVQEQGRSVIFAGYHLRVGEVAADSALPPGEVVRQQRFDETQTGLAKALVIVEHTAPREGAIAMPGALQAERVDSLYVAGKQVILGGWESQEAAERWYAAQPVVSEQRLRRVRIIRDYGMYDRHEAPQYYPPVPPSSLIW